VCSDFFYKFV